MKVTLEFNTNDPKQFEKIQEALKLMVEESEAEEEGDSEPEERRGKKLTIELPIDDGYEYKDMMQYLTGPKVYSFLWDYMQVLRSAWKYEDLEGCGKELQENECCNKVVDKLREKFYDMLSGDGINVDDLIY